MNNAVLEKLWKTQENKDHNRNLSQQKEKETILKFPCIHKER